MWVSKTNNEDTSYITTRSFSHSAKLTAVPCCHVTYPSGKDLFIVVF
jgi:hypothetical protein